MPKPVGVSCFNPMAKVVLDSSHEKNLLSPKNINQQREIILENRERKTH